MLVVEEFYPVEHILYLAVQVFLQGRRGRLGDLEEELAEVDLYYLELVADTPRHLLETGQVVQEGESGQKEVVGRQSVLVGPEESVEVEQGRGETRRTGVAV